MSDLLFAPQSYKDASPALLDEICNGCGTEGFGGWVVPDTIWLLSITECCNIHDWMYALGQTIEDKDKADRVFLNNMMRLIEDGSSWFRALRRHRALVYYNAVKSFGGPAFWDNKNP